MGRDKAGLVVDGEAMARRLGRLLAARVAPALEVGPGRSGLEAVREVPPFGGPLAALVAGWRALRVGGHTGPVLVLACDLPFVDDGALELLCEWPGEGSVVPVVDGRRQLLSARWSADDLSAAEVALGAGATALRSVPLGDDLVELGPADWVGRTAPGWTTDCDTPGDLERVGLGGLTSEGLTSEGPASEGPTGERIGR